MEYKLLGTCKCGKATVRFWVTPMSDTPEKRQALVEGPTRRFLMAIRKNNPEAYKKLGRPVGNDK